MGEDTTQIRVTTDQREQLHALKQQGESYSDVLERRFNIKQTLDRDGQISPEEMRERARHIAEELDGRDIESWSTDDPIGVFGPPRPDGFLSALSELSESSEDLVLVLPSKYTIEPYDEAIEAVETLTEIADEITEE